MNDLALYSLGIKNQLLGILDYLEHGPVVADLSDLDIADVHRSCLAFDRLSRAAEHTLKALLESRP